MPNLISRKTNKWRVKQCRHGTETLSRAQSLCAAYEPHRPGMPKREDTLQLLPFSHPALFLKRQGSHDFGFTWETSMVNKDMTIAGFDDALWSSIQEEVHRQEEH